MNTKTHIFSIASICWIVFTAVNSACARADVSESSTPAADSSVAETPPDLASLTAEADLVAIVQVITTDYEKTRGFPSSGSAYLSVLIPYKGSAKGDIIEVKEQGIEDTACYYPEVQVLQLEGDRFLAFLKKDGPEKETYHGYMPGCKVPILVTADNSYAIVFPVPGLALPEDQAQELIFGDPSAMLDLTDWSQSQAEAFAESWQMRQVPPGPEDASNARIYQYTRGILVPGLYKLLFPEGVPHTPKQV